jgi:hypothetical protein
MKKVTFQFQNFIQKEPLSAQGFQNGLELGVGGWGLCYFQMN